MIFFFFSSRRRHTRFSRDWSSDVCSSDLAERERERGHGGEAGTFPQQTNPKTQVLPECLHIFLNKDFSTSHTKNMKAPDHLRDPSCGFVEEITRDAARPSGQPSSPAAPESNRPT